MVTNAPQNWISNYFSYECIAYPACQLLSFCVAGDSVLILEFLELRDPFRSTTLMIVYIFPCLSVCKVWRKGEERRYWSFQTTLMSLIVCVAKKNNIFRDIANMLIRHTLLVLPYTHVLLYLLRFRWLWRWKQVFYLLLTYWCCGYVSFIYAYTYAI